MDGKLFKNGKFVCDLIPSVVHPLPKKHERCWKHCVLVIPLPVEFQDHDIFMVEIPGMSLHPFQPTKSHVGVEGWELAGKVLV